MKSNLFCVITLSLLASASGGCSDPTLDTAPAPTQNTKPLSITLEQDKAAMPNAAGITAPAITAEVKPLGGVAATEQTLHTINTFLIEYQANGSKIPASVEEMVQAKIIPPVPPAPVGKRFNVDTKKALVTFADI